MEKVKKVLVNIVVISFNSRELTLQCIQSVYDTIGLSPDDFIVTIVDNNSTDGSVEAIRQKFPQVNIICNPENYGYAKAVNIGAGSIEAKYLIISNSDIVFLEDSIRILIEQLNGATGITGPMQFFPNGKYQFLLLMLPGTKMIIANFMMIVIPIKILARVVFKLHLIPRKKKVDYIDGAVVTVKKELFDRVGGFDEDYFFYTEEADFAYRLSELHYKHYVLKEAKVIHYRGGSGENSGINAQAVKKLINTKAIFCKKHLFKRQTYLYMTSEIFYNIILLNIWKFMFFLKFSKKSDNKLEFLNLTIKYWKEERKEFLKIRK